ncbi:MAG: PAS domain S-box protein [Deltaproteobacteria bacterium]|nr:PAS domain S-box protein [Deltaproteobacteria bacterium]
MSNQTDFPLSFKSSIARRLILYIFLFSTLLICLVTLFQLFLDYRKDVSRIEDRIRQIAGSHLTGIIRSLWELDDDLLKIQMEGVLRLPDIQYLEIKQTDGRIIALGTPESEGGIRRQFLLRYTSDGKEYDLGMLSVVAGMDGVYQRLIDRAILILLTQAFEIIIVSMFIYFLFHFQVGRHLHSIAVYAGSLDMNRADAPLELQRGLKKHSGKDELDQLVFSINKMQSNIRVLYQSLGINVEELKVNIIDLKNVEKALRESEEKYRTLIETTNTGYVILDLQGRVLDANAEYVRLTGHDTLQEIMGKKVTGWTATHDLERNAKEVERCVESGFVRNLEIDYVDATGAIIPVEINAALIKTAEGPVILSLCRDISTRKLAGAALRESEERYRLLADQSLQGIAVFKGIPPTFIYVNPTWTRIFGYTSEEALSLDSEQIWNLVHPDDRAFVRERNLDRLMGKPAEPRYEFRIIRKDGTLHWVEVFANIIESGTQPSSQALYTDITSRKRSEEERLGLATAIEHAADAIILTDKYGKIEYVNPATEKATGFGREELVGHNFTILRSDQHDDAFYKTMWTRISSGQVWSGHIVNRIRDGSLCEFETKISPVKDTFGNVIRYVSVNRDVTQEIKLEKQVRQAQKMEAIGTLAGGIAHDFNNILAAILGYTELTRSTMPQETPEYRNLEQVIKASSRARDLVQQILLFSRQGAEELKPVRVSIIVKEALQLLRATLPSTIEIRQNLSSSSESRILADPTQIHQVLMNLGTTAAHAMREKGGILEVSLSDVDSESDAQPNPELKPGSYIQLTVSDTGHGMDRGVMDRMFDPFFTTKRSGEGTGMGLSVVHGIVKRHNGTLSVSSQVGKGTVFHLFIPRIEDLKKDTPESLSVVSKGRGRILFVDDEKTLVELVQQILEFLGYEVIARTSAMEALELFRSQPDQFDLVITDYTMPHMTGLALAKEILNIRPDEPIILCTGYNEMITEENARSTGIREFIMKPVTINELSKKVAAALDKG